uniref:Uncharacterized protein n=1 Tax=Utricularia reniformis TaxID=192314 RepID=A0A1Y0AZV1_9LAMI|nr:hypothetical protein AEK19_MT0441 [Utricularia reniformis]ART30705.1 hypothetical protein AEK19_MT0441 [Utricularia reniformis]
MILGPKGQKSVCAAGVERSTLHRCGLTGLNPFFHSSIEGVVEVIKKRSFYYLDRKTKIRCLLTGSFLLCQRY